MSHFLWVIDLSYQSRLHHGGLLRYFNFSRELMAQGHSVTFAVCHTDDGGRGGVHQWLDGLRSGGVFTDYFDLDIDPSLPRWRRAATFLLPFGLHQRALQPFADRVRAALESAAGRVSADVLIVSSRMLIFFAHTCRGCPSIGDFSDSATLYTWREIAWNLRRREIRNLFGLFRDLFQFYFLERFSSRRYSANVIVSSADKRIFDRFTDRRNNVLIPNGVRAGPHAGSLAKVPHQIVFSGVMNFAPNCDAALWFLDRVFPIVLKSRPDLVLSIAGPDPPEKLRARACANVRIPGYVPDLSLLLAESALYVAPLVTGGGFKNKVIEAIANGTYVIGTSLCAEFLEPAIRDLMVIEDDPRKFAAAICEFYAEPEKFAERLDRLRGIVLEEFSWTRGAKQLTDLAESLKERDIIHT